MPHPLDTPTHQGVRLPAQFFIIQCFSSNVADILCHHYVVLVLILSQLLGEVVQVPLSSLVVWFCSGKGDRVCVCAGAIVQMVVCGGGGS